MVMAYWNGMTWGVSSQQIAFLESLSTSFSVNTSTNADKEGKSPTERVAKNLVEFSLSTTYRVETGTKDIRAVINRWTNLVGKADSFVIGNQIFGPDKMQLMSVDVSDVRLTANGVMMSAKLAFKFKEYSEDGESHYTAPSGSAVNIGPTPSEKESRKPLVIFVPVDRPVYIDVPRKHPYMDERRKY